MPEGDRPAPAVELLRVGVELGGPRQRNGREGLVDLVGVEVVDSEKAAIEGSDILIAGTSTSPDGPSGFPYFKREWIKPGALILCPAAARFDDDFIASEKAQIVGHDADFHLTRTPVVLDRQGLEEGLRIFEQARLAMADVERRCAERGGDGEEEALTVSAVLGLFKVPR